MVKPISVAENDVIRSTDLDGLEKQIAVDGSVATGPVNIDAVNASILSNFTKPPAGCNMEVFELAQQATSKEDFLKFLQALIDDFANNRERWENPELGRYLDAMKAFMSSSTDRSINKIDFTPSWSLFARIMYTATIYE